MAEEQWTILGEDAVHDFLMEYKKTLHERNEWIFEGTIRNESRILLENVYTELHFIEGESKLVNDEHEIWYTEQLSSKQFSHEGAITYNDVFTSTDNRIIRTVLTKGIAGIGKTVSVQKFILDWAEGNANCDIDLIFLLPFRALNLVKDDRFSLQSLLIYLCPELDSFVEEVLKKPKLVFILDGLDESKFKLNFEYNVLDATKESKLDELLARLIKGKLLPNAYVWVTSRLTAANAIPSEYIHRVTEIQGFSDKQKEEYLRKRINDKHVNSIISHIKQFRPLNKMCHIPSFCQISANVLQEMLRQNKTKLPVSLFEIYTHLLLIQTEIEQQKNASNSEGESGKVFENIRTMILKLAKLAFKQLMKGNVVFYDEDLQECGIDVVEASVYSAILTEASVLNQRKVYCFVHLSFQEFLAAFYAFNCYVSKSMEALHDFKPMYIGWSENVQLHELLNNVVDKALESEKGRLDLFLRFLLSISLKSNWTLLQGLLISTHGKSMSIEKTIKKITDHMYRESIPAKRALNLFLCLTEVREKTFTRQIERYSKSEKPPKKYLSPGHCTAIAYMMQMSEEVINVLDVKKFNTTKEGFRRLVPAARNCRKVILGGYNLTTRYFEILRSVLQSPDSSLKELDLSNSINLQDSEWNLLLDGLKSSHCKLQILKLCGCKLLEKSFRSLASVLQSVNSCLWELDLSNNILQDSGVEILSDGLKSPHCKLETLRLALCNVEEKACEILGSLLQSKDFPLRELDLSNNDLHDPGVKLLSDGLKSSYCKLETLGLSGCSVTEEGCSYLASALSSNPSHLKELDLTYNHPGDSGVKLLSARLEDPHCRLDTLRMEHAEENRIKPGLKKYACQLTLDPNTAHTHFSLSEGNRRVTSDNKDHVYPDHPDRFESWGQVLCKESLYGRCYWETEWSGGGTIAVAYKGISRKGCHCDCGFGNNIMSWSLNCDDGYCYLKHDDMRFNVPPPPSSSKKVGVYLDWLAGTLSFYSISSETHTLNHLHTFNSTFTEPLYAGFGGFTSLCLCEIE